MPTWRGICFGKYVWHQERERSPLVARIGRHLGSRSLRDKRLRLAHPVLILDAATQGEGLIHVGDVVVGEIGDLLELDDAQAIELGRELCAHSLDPREIIGLSLRSLEALKGSIEAFRTRIGALEYARGLAAPATQVIELGAAYLAPADHVDLGDVGRVDRKHALDAFAVGDLAHREALVDAGAGAGNHHAFVGLQPETRALVLLLGLGALPLVLGVGLGAFHHLDHHLDRIAGGEFRHTPLRRDGFHLTTLKIVNDGHGSHGSPAKWNETALPASARAKTARPCHGKSRQLLAQKRRACRWGCRTIPLGAAQEAQVGLTSAQAGTGCASPVDENQPPAILEPPPPAGAGRPASPHHKCNASRQTAQHRYRGQIIPLNGVPPSTLHANRCEPAAPRGSPPPHRTWPNRLHRQGRLQEGEASAISPGHTGGSTARASCCFLVGMTAPPTPSNGSEPSRPPSREAPALVR